MMPAVMKLGPSGLALAAAAATFGVSMAIAQTAPPAPPGVAEGTAPGPRIETRIHRAKKMLREKLERKDQ